MEGRWRRLRTARQRTPSCSMVAKPEPAGRVLGGLVSCWWGVWESGGRATAQDQTN